MKNATARILITQNCNFKCQYCINKREGTLDSFTKVTLPEFVQTIAPRYDTINISGGEPFFNIPWLLHIVDSLRYRCDNIYIYSNGILIMREIYSWKEHKRMHLFNILQSIKGITIGVHGHGVMMCQYIDMQDTLSMFTNVRFIGIEEHTDKEQWARDNPLANLKLVPLNTDCSNNNEDRYIIEV